MPWLKRDLMSLCEEFVQLVETEVLPLALFCQRFGISGKMRVAGAVRHSAKRQNPFRGKQPVLHHDRPASCVPCRTRHGARLLTRAPKPALHAN